jgi:hypothetical protein
MPVTAAHAALGGAGLLTSLVGVVAYRRKATLPFKVAYALAWPLLGSAAILLLQPAAPEAERTLGAADAARLAQVRALNAGTRAAIQARRGGVLRCHAGARVAQRRIWARCV